MVHAWDDEYHMLELMADTVPGLVAYINQAEELRFINDHNRAWFGQDPKTYINLPLRESIGEDEYFGLVPYLKKGLSGIPSNFEIELKNAIVAKWVRGRVLPDKDARGQVLGVICVLIDITEEKEEAERLRRSSEGLQDLRRVAERVAEDKSRFLAAASHDLRQPLHAMTLFTRALGRRVAGEEAIELVRQLGLSLQSLQQMFTALLDVSKLDAGLIEANIQNLSFTRLVEPLINEFEAVAAERGLSFRSRVSDIAIRTDPALFQTAVRNVLTNAFKFTKSGSVMLVCRQRSDHLLLQVIDTGPGMDDQRLAKIFSEFERGKTTASGRSNDGLGLGLTIVQRVTALIDASVDVSSRVGRGTTFSFRFPRAIELSEDVDDILPTLHTDKAISRGSRVMVLDDDPSVLAALSLELKDLGFEIMSGSSTKAIPDLLAKHGKPDAAILDFDLGNDTGLSAHRQIEDAIGQRVPAMIVTGSTEPEVLRLLENSGLRWMTKPVDPHLMAASLTGLLQSSQKSA